MFSFENKKGHFQSKEAIKAGISAGIKNAPMIFGGLKNDESSEDGLGNSDEGYPRLTLTTEIFEVGMVPGANRRSVPCYLISLAS